MSSLTTTTAPISIVEEIFENQRLSPVAGWSLDGLLGTDPLPWSDRGGGLGYREFPELPLPNDWQWSTQWTVDLTYTNTDEAGWTYALDFPEFEAQMARKGRSVAKAGVLHFVRRRRWVRTRLGTWANSGDTSTTTVDRSIMSAARYNNNGSVSSSIASSRCSMVNSHQPMAVPALEIAMEGYIGKQDPLSKIWKERYCILRRDTHSLCFFKSRDDLQLLSEFKLDLQTMTVMDTNDTGSPFQFCCKCGKRELLLNSATQDTKKEWMAAMVELKEEAVLQTNNTTIIPPPPPSSASSSITTKANGTIIVQTPIAPPRATKKTDSTVIVATPMPPPPVTSKPDDSNSNNDDTIPPAPPSHSRPLSFDANFDDIHNQTSNISMIPRDPNETSIPPSNSPPISPSSSPICSPGKNVQVTTTSVASAVFPPPPSMVMFTYPSSNSQNSNSDSTVAAKILPSSSLSPDVCLPPPPPPPPPPPTAPTAPTAPPIAQHLTISKILEQTPPPPPPCQYKQQPKEYHAEVEIRAAALSKQQESATSILQSFSPQRLSQKENICNNSELDFERAANSRFQEKLASLHRENAVVMEEIRDECNLYKQNCERMTKEISELKRELHSVRCAHDSLLHKLAFSPQKRGGASSSSLSSSSLSSSSSAMIGQKQKKKRSILRIGRGDDASVVKFRNADTIAVANKLAQELMVQINLVSHLRQENGQVVEQLAQCKKREAFWKQRCEELQVVPQGSAGPELTATSMIKSAAAAATTSQSQIAAAQMILTNAALWCAT